ncbi:MAG: YicC family protein [Candidatus Eiseniibacteriota bacterium]|nr:MAG: YicC family protein [Candidatus Eisenbacteria bacterium]
MVRSMTGFGRSEVEHEGTLLVTEIRSVNHRFCEISVRLPKWLVHLEPAVRSLVQARILRGKVSVAVTWNGESGEGILELDTDVADRYFRMLKELKERYGLAGEIELGTLAAFPDLFTPDRVAVEEEKSKGLIQKCVTGALDSVLAMKMAEGESLEADLRGRVEGLLKHIDVIEKRAPARVSEARENLRSRLSGLLEGAEIPEERLALEVVILADKLDCSEECVRLRAHVRQFMDLLGSPEPSGRKLNFLLQEMNREANTLGSKAADVEIVNEVVVIKDELEKLREQVQNVE